MRLYYEYAHEPHATEPTSVPLGLAQFRNDTRAVRRFAERLHSNIVSWHSYDTAGHYAAHEVPELLVADMRQFFDPLRYQVVKRT